MFLPIVDRSRTASGYWSVISVSYTHLDVYKRQHPPYREGFAGHPLVVMSYPRQLEREAYDRFYQYLCSVVMKTL